MQRICFTFNRPLCKNNGSVSCVGINFLLWTDVRTIPYPYSGRTWELWIESETHSFTVTIMLFKVWVGVSYSCAWAGDLDMTVNSFQWADFVMIIKQILCSAVFILTLLQQIGPTRAHKRFAALPEKKNKTFGSFLQTECNSRVKKTPLFS